MGCGSSVPDDTSRLSMASLDREEPNDGNETDVEKEDEHMDYKFDGVNRDVVLSDIEEELTASGEANTDKGQQRNRLTFKATAKATGSFLALRQVSDNHDDQQNLKDNAPPDTVNDSSSGIQNDESLNLERENNNSDETRKSSLQLDPQEPESQNQETIKGSYDQETNLEPKEEELVKVVVDNCHEEAADERDENFEDKNEVDHDKSAIEDDVNLESHQDDTNNEKKVDEAENQNDDEESQENDTSAATELHVEDTAETNEKVDEHDEDEKVEEKEEKDQESYHDEENEKNTSQ